MRIWLCLRAGFLKSGTLDVLSTHLHKASQLLTIIKHFILFIYFILNDINFIQGCPVQRGWFEWGPDEKKKQHKKQLHVQIKKNWNN